MNVKKMKEVVGYRYSIAPTLQDLVDQYSADFDSCLKLPCSIQGSAGKEGDVPDPGWSGDYHLRWVSVALAEMHQNPETSSDRAARAWALQHHLAATEMSLEDFRKEPLPLKVLVAEAMELYKPPLDLFIYSACNEIKIALSEDLGIEMQYLPLDSEDESEKEEPASP